MKAILSLLLLAFALTGCSVLQPKPQERIVYKYVRVPAAMTNKVTITAPPAPEFYSTLPWDKQESLLIDLLQDHTRSLGVCNTRLVGIEAWSNEQLKVYNDPPKEPAKEP